MKHKIKLAQQLLLLLLLSACAGTKPATRETLGGEVSGSQKKTLTEFEEINKLFDAGRFEESAIRYDQLMRNSSVHQLDGLILFNAGLSYLQAGQCDMAANRLREVVRRTEGKAPALKARAIMKLGEAYVCLGDDTKAIVNLIEAYNNRAHFSAEVGKAELPAKLAAAYARIGNRRMAEQFFRRAERGLIELQMNLRSDRERKESLARTLYLMGSLSQINIQTMSADDYFASLRALQKYLFKAVELDSEVWSRRAYDDINLGYQNIWKYIEKVDSSPDEADARLAARKAQIERLEIAQTALQSIKAIYNERIPDTAEPAVVRELMAKLQQHEIKVRNFIATNIVGSTLTDAALEAQAIRKAGRVYNPDPILERQALKRMQKEPSKQQRANPRSNR